MKRYIKTAVTALVVAFMVCMTGCVLPPRNVENRSYSVMMTERAYIEPTATGITDEMRASVVDVFSLGESSSSAGSGVIIGKGAEVDTEEYDQYFIVTNHHVISGGKSFTVDVLSISDEGESTTAYQAVLVGSSLKRDIAVLSIRPPKGTEFCVASFVDDSDKVKVGTEVYAIGNPLGILGGTVTHGIISATKREVNVEGIGTMTLMQTDASINGGNSGGGLFDGYGNLVGIINSGFDSYNDRHVEGLNFAIPANDAKEAALKLIETHREENGAVTEYGYIEGDARMDITFSSATLYTSSSLSARANFTVAEAANSDSPLYAEWGESVKVINSVTVNGVKTDLTRSEKGSYSSTEEANKAIAAVKAGDTVVIEYRDVLSSSGMFGFSRNYAAGAVKSITIVAQQYIYEP